MKKNLLNSNWLINAAEQITNAAIEDFCNFISRSSMTFAVDDLISEKCDDEIKKIIESVYKIKKCHRDDVLIDYEHGKCYVSLNLQYHLLM